jgi:branched-chain amino acid transport system ATP-binding protein
MTADQILGAPVGVFIGLTLVIVGGAAVAAGRALGDGWKPAWTVVVAAVGLAAADRFLIFALFDGSLLSPWGYVFHFLVLAALGLLSWRVTRVGRMVAQYPWRYERASPFAYREKATG